MRAGRAPGPETNFLMDHRGGGAALLAEARMEGLGAACVQDRQVLTGESAWDLLQQGQ